MDAPRPPPLNEAALRLALVAASPLVRAGLRAGLGAEPGLVIASEQPRWPAQPDEAFAGAAVAVLDLDDDGEREAEAEGPGQGRRERDRAADSAEQAFDAAAEGGPVPVLLAARPGDWLTAARAHGAGVLPRQATVAQIAAAVRAAAAGLVATLPGAWRHADAARTALRPPLQALTPREREVLQQMVLGQPNRGIAQALHISAHTAKFHVAQVIAKLDAGSRAHAVAKALQAGLVTL